MKTIISWLFLLYFFILCAERMQSLIRTGKGEFLNGRYLASANMFVVFSLSVTAVMLIFFNGNLWRSLFNTSVMPDYKMLSVTAGIMLVSGMIHTKYTIVPVQFVAYGALIIAMILQTITFASQGNGIFSYWYSLGYAVIFSMAIPVVYPTTIKKATLFVIIEYLVMLSLVICFTLMLSFLMSGRGNNLLWWIPLVILILGDNIVVAMPWNERQNSFLMITEVLTVAAFAVGKIIL